MADLIRALKTFIKDPSPTGRFEEVSAGLHVLDGIVKVDEPLRSPVRGQNCVAYFYSAILFVKSARSPQPSMSKLRESQVYTAFTLVMDKGSVAIVPTRPGSFSREDHQRLAADYGTSFQAMEDVILPGARVRVWGKVRAAEGGPVMRMTKIQVLDKQAVAAGVVGDRKTRRKKR
ncbi:MAG: hypothetical protein PHU25_15725 [Deltaproteobacteria bacterium]|nr:hypothetical protein [Deltaproteobacteria bacterium]